MCDRLNSSILEYRHVQNSWYKQYQSIIDMQPQQQQVKGIYLVETGFKAGFILMAILNLPYTTLVGLLASVCGLLRMLKIPQLNKEYLQKVRTNPHGQNLLYIGMGCMGPTNFLFFAPLALYFFYGLAQFYNQKMPGAISPKIQTAVNSIRHNRSLFMEAKSRIEIIYFLYLLLTIPLDFSRVLRCLLMGQFNLLKYRDSLETQHAAKNINAFVESKISGLGFLLSAYQKLIGYVHSFATRQP